VLMALLAGGALAGSGAVMQGALRNPLADPYILGTSAGAAVGFMLAALAGLTNGSPLFYLVTGLGAFFATAASYFLARVKGRAPGVNLLLAGVIVNSFLGAVILLLFTVLRNEGFSVLIFMMGSVTEGNGPLWVYAGLLFVLGAVAGYLPARAIDTLALGEDKAFALGVNPEKLKLLMFGSAALMTAAAVAVSGVIGFAGLIVPHAMRIFMGPGHKKLFPASVLCGAAFLAAMDAIARSVAAPAEIPVGILTALCGAPFFLYVMRKQCGEYRF
ncbi:MAG: iron ABC transporter permease, partial [Elusimicrobiaceae bacterium]|nr:iron ABC transporter permease [Elusimicrobiaceae bacterium]